MFLYVFFCNTGREVGDFILFLCHINGDFGFFFVGCFVFTNIFIPLGRHGKSSFFKRRSVMYGSLGTQKQEMWNQCVIRVCNFVARKGSCCITPQTREVTTFTRKEA